MSVYYTILFLKTGIKSIFMLTANDYIKFLGVFLKYIFFYEILHDKLPF